MSCSNKREPRLAKPPPSGQSITKGVVSVLTVSIFYSSPGAANRLAKERLGIRRLSTS